MTIDHNVCAAARLFDEPAIGPLEEELLGALKEHDTNLMQPQDQS